MKRKSAVWAVIALAATVAAMAVTKVVLAGTRSISTSWQVNNAEPWADPPPDQPSLCVEVISDTGADHFIDTTITETATGAFVFGHEIESVGFFDAAEKQSITHYLAHYSSGTSFTITSKFKDMSNTVIDTQTATFVKP